MNNQELKYEKNMLKMSINLFIDQKSKGINKHNSMSGDQMSRMLSKFVKQEDYKSSLMA
jgi:hypothetical protein